jgi:hypothetical protein
VEPFFSLQGAKPNTSSISQHEIGVCTPSGAFFSQEKYRETLPLEKCLFSGVDKKRLKKD